MQIIACKVERVGKRHHQGASFVEELHSDQRNDFAIIDWPDVVDKWEVAFELIKLLQGHRLIQQLSRLVLLLVLLKNLIQRWWFLVWMIHIY
jgi:hypothetical protein